MGEPRKMPSEAQIRRHWGDFLLKEKDFDSFAETQERGVCFACGSYSKVERAHIVAKSVGGSDTADNLHMLCSECHKASEYLDGDKYWRWFRSRNAAHSLLMMAMRSGFNPDFSPEKSPE